MPATSVPEVASAPVTEIMPTVVHNEGRRMVTLTVLVSPRPGGKDIDVAVAPIALPQKDWTVRWVLMVSPELIAEFSDPGILVDEKELPPMVQVAQETNGKQECSRVITNAVRSSNQFNYWISLEWKFAGRTESFRKKKLHDPTISVTQDPVGRWVDQRDEPASA